MNLYHTTLFLCFFSILILSCQSKNKSNLGLNKINNSKPNIVIIYADDLGFGDVSLYGASEISTPNIDDIGKEGIKFTNAYASSPDSKNIIDALLGKVPKGNLLLYS